MIFIHKEKIPLLELPQSVKNQLTLEVKNLKKIINRNNVKYEGTDPVEDAIKVKKA